MANIKSQIKRNRQNEKRRLRNRTVRGAARTAIGKARTTLEGDVLVETKESVLKAISMLDKAAEKGVLHPNNAARRKSRLMKRLAEFSAKAQEPAAETATEETTAKKAGGKKAAK